MVVRCLSHFFNLLNDAFGGQERVLHDVKTLEFKGFSAKNGHCAQPPTNGLHGKTSRKSLELRPFVARAEKRSAPGAAAKSDNDTGRKRPRYTKPTSFRVAAH